MKIQVLEKGEFQKQMLEKLIWICAFMLVGARHPGATVGVVEKEYRSEVSIYLCNLQYYEMQSMRLVSAILLLLLIRCDKTGFCLGAFGSDQC